MPMYAKFLKGLLTNKARLEEACMITMNERCSAVLLNKLQSKEKDPGSFTIPCEIGQLHINNALAYLGASISLMPYTMYEKLGLGEPKATRMSLELVDRSIQHPRGIIENVFIKVDKFILRIDFVILDMFEDSRVPIILGRPFLATAWAMTKVFNKKITLRVGDDEVIFDVDQSIKRPPTKDDECYGIDDLDNTINIEAQELLANNEPNSFLSRGLEKSIDQSDLEGCEPVECNTDNDSKEPIQHIASINTSYLVVHKIAEPIKVEREHLYSASANEIDEKKPELKDFPNHLEYAYLHGDKSFPIIISSELSDEEKISLLQVLAKQKGAIAWKMSDIKGISPSYCTHKILMEDDFKPVIQPQRHLNPKIQDVVKNKIAKLLDSGLIYLILDSSWVSPIHIVPKKGGMTVVLNDNNELIPSRTITGWRVCIDYRKLNDATRKDHFPLPFIDQMLDRLCRNGYYHFLDGFLGFFQIPIAPEDQEKTTFVTFRIFRIMPPRRFKKKSVRKIVERRVAKAMEKYEKTKVDSNNTGGSGSTNTGGTNVPEMHGCSYKTFMNCKPHSFKGTEGVVGLKRWFEKMEQVFEICKCAEDDKVKFAMCTFEGRALTWWNGNVQTLGLANANQIPWSNVKAMMTTEYCPATEIQRMEQELWTLTLKGDDIEAYNNRFHELALMCHELVPTEKKKIERYIRGFPERIKGNITSSKPATRPSHSPWGCVLFLEDRSSLGISSVESPERKICTFANPTPSPCLLERLRLMGWGDMQDDAFQILKEKLCNAPVLALPDGPDELGLCDAYNKGFGTGVVFVMQRGKIELLSVYECLRFQIPPGKANVVADALSRKERLKPRRVRAMSITIHSGLKTKILEVHSKASKDLKALTDG
ncbi:DNA-directed DNA polymerase [Tanacetum coccineum]